MRIAPGLKIDFWNHLSEERPENPQKFHRNPFRSHIESIKSSVKRSQKVTLKTCPGLFLKWLSPVDFLFRNVPFDGLKPRDQARCGSNFAVVPILWLNRSVFLHFWMCVFGSAIGGEDVHFHTLPDSYP